MPPEPPPFDRKDYGAAAAASYKDRKNHLYDGPLTPSGGGGGTPRWRDPYHHHLGPPPPIRDYPRVSPRRPPAGYHRQGGGNGYERGYADEPGFHVYTSSRSDRHYAEDEPFRRYGNGGGCRNGRDARDMRSSYRRSPWRATNEPPRFHHSHPYRQPSPVQQPHQQEHEGDLSSSSLRSVTIHRSPVSRVSADESTSQNKVNTGSRPDPDRNQEGGLDSQPRPWKSLKWPLSGSLAAAKDGQSDSVAVAGAAPVTVTADKEEQQGSAVAVHHRNFEEAPKKRPRLGWGQGLAKYEKQKVQDSVDSSLPVQESGLDTASSEKASLNVIVDACDMVHIPQDPEICSSLAAESPAEVCGSPAVIENICNEGVEDSCAGHSNNTEHPAAPTACEADFPVTIEFLDFDPSSLEFLSSIVAVDRCGESSVLHTGLSKLSQLKAEISKELEKTEVEIDMTESQLRSLDFLVASEIHSGTPMANCDKHGPFLEASNDCFEFSGAEENKLITHVQEKVYEVTMRNTEELGLKDEADSHLYSLACSGQDNQSESADLFNNDNLITLKGEMAAGRSSTVTSSDAGSAVMKKCSIDSLCSNSKMSSNLIALVLSSNWQAAQIAFRSFERALPDKPLKAELWNEIDLSSCKDNELKIGAMIAVRKRRLKFKEQVLTFKFKALLHMWKVNMHLHSVRKNRAKTNKRCDFGTRASQPGPQKQIGLHLTYGVSPSKKSILAPTDGTTDLVKRLWSDFHCKQHREFLKMPPQFIDEYDRRSSMFQNYNCLVEDPIAVEKEKKMINPWTQEEKEVFMEMLATFGKDFSRISSCLAHKTTADCVEFYYKSHKSESFREVRKCLGLKKQRQNLPASTYLATSEKKWNPEKNAASLGILEAASTVTRQSVGLNKCSEKNKLSIHYKESVAVDVLAGISGTMSSSDVIGSCITSSVDPGDKINYVHAYHSLGPDVRHFPHDEVACTDEGCGEVDPVDWTDEEKSLFMQAINKFGKDFSRVSSFVRSRSQEQCKVFFSKARKSLCLDLIANGNGNLGISICDANGGRSDSDDVGAAEIDSAICSTQSCSKHDGDGSPSVAKDGSQGSLAQGVSSHLDGGAAIQHVLGGVTLEDDESNTGKNACLIDEDKLNDATEMTRTDSIETLKENVDISCNGGVRMRASETAAEDTGLDDSGALVPRSEHFVLEREHGADFLIDGGIQLNCSSSEYPLENVKREVTYQVPDSRVEAKTSAGQVLCVESTGSRFVPGISNGKAPQTGLNPLPSARTKQHSIPLSKEAFLPVQFDSALPCVAANCFDGVMSNTTFNFESHSGKGNSSSINNVSGLSSRNDILKQVDVKQDSYRGLSFQKKLNKVDQHLHDANEFALHTLELGAAGRENDMDIHINGVHVPVSQVNQVTAAAIENGSSASSTSPHPNCHSIDNIGAHLRPCCQPAETGKKEQFQRPGDVKIFGKILSHRESLDGIYSLSDDGNVNLSSIGSSSFEKMEVCNGVKDVVLYSSRPGTSGHLGAEERSLRNYGFWDASRIQKAVPSLQDSSALMAGVPFYSPRNGILSSNWALAGYPSAFQALDHKYIDGFPRTQRKNVAEIVSGLQQQQPGKLVSGMTDPVAALRVQLYATNGQKTSSDAKLGGTDPA